MTTEDLMKLADKFAFFMPGSEEGEKARQALLDALQSQAERIKELRLQVVSAFGQAQEALEERDTIRAKLAALQVNAGLVDACGRYEAALMAAFPNGAHGEAFTQWNEARKLLAKRAQAAPAVGVPDGYVLVPVEPTPEMIRQGRITPCTADEMDADDDYRAVYKAMLAASAQPQQKEG